jgi:hypothetical protein
MLIGVALLGIAISGVAAFLSSNDFDAGVPEVDIARLTDLWIAGGGDGVLPVTLMFLAIGAIIGGATVTGAEWQNGTVVTVCTWEPRRGKLLGARILSATVLAGAIAAVLLALFGLSLGPTYVLRGTTEGADAAFWFELAGAVGRFSGLTALAAAAGAAAASIGRRTTVALGVSFAYLAIVEGAVRGIWPGRARWLIGENAAILATAADLDGAAFSRGTTTAALTLGGYVAVLVAASVMLFRHRDLVSTS